MKIISEKDEYAIKNAIFSLKEGNIICFPTETVYALSCDIDNRFAINKIYDLKQREKNKALSVLCRSIDDIKYFCNISEELEVMINKYSPGPITYVLEVKPELKSKYAHFTNNDFIGLRIPDHAFALKLLNTFNKPVIATSVNISGQESSSSVEEIINYFSETPFIDLVINGGKSKFSQGSTVIKHHNNKIEILRDGALKI